MLRPTQPLHLRAGEHVRIIVLRAPDPARWDLDRLAGGHAIEDAELAEAGLPEWADELAELETATDEALGRAEP